MNILKKIPIISLILIVFIIFHNGLNNFYSYDDFFHFRISQASNLKQFVGFFNLLHDQNNWGYYRPLSTQTIYWIVANIFKYNVFIAHLLIWSLFYILIFIVYKFLYHFTKNKTIIWVSIILYALSASHFSHLYSLLATQEIILSIFYLLSLNYYINFLKYKKIRQVFFSLFCFVLSLMSKESAATLPAMIVFINIFFHKKQNLKDIIRDLAPYLIITFGYLYLHIFKFGLVSGDSYIWKFTPKVFVNSLAWYVMWAINMPTTIINYIGPGLNINPRLFTETKPYFLPSFFFIILFILTVVISFIKQVKNNQSFVIKNGIFTLFWFVTPLAPVIFMQWHKYPTYLTIPFIFLAYFISSLIYKSWSGLARYTILSFILILFSLSSYLTVRLNEKTNWLTLGAKTSKRVKKYMDNYFNNNPKKQSISILYYDEDFEKKLPWVPSDQIKMALSDDDFFKIFYPKKNIIVYYMHDKSKIPQNVEIVRLRARNFVTY